MEGYPQAANKNMIPADLGEEWGHASLKQWREHRRSEKKATGGTKRQIVIQETQQREAQSKRDKLQRLTDHMTLNGCGSWVDMQYKNDTDWLYWEEWHREQMTLRQKTQDGNAAQAASNKTEWKALFAQRAGVKEGVT